jgi:rfaE bifunctional protein kinase chain/domain
MVTTGMTQAQAEAYIEQFTGARVLVLGDIMLDRYFWGQVDRISPEAPVPVVRIDRRSARLGGAANVAANLNALGARASLAGLVGDDRAGDEVMSLLGSRRIDHSAVVVESGADTTEKVRIIAQSQQVVRADFESKSPGRDSRTVIDRAIASCSDYEALIISDYGKGVLSEGNLGELIGAWRTADKAVLVDPHVGHFPWYRGASLVTPNTKEALSYFGAVMSREELLRSGAFRMRDELELDALLITQGEEGMSLYLDRAKRVHIPTDAEEVYDVTGAGDTVISVLGVAMACDVPLIDGVVLANRAAGEVIKEVGTTAITRERLLAAFEE